MPFFALKPKKKKKLLNELTTSCLADVQVKKSTF